MRVAWRCRVDCELIGRGVGERESEDEPMIRPYVEGDRVTSVCACRVVGRAQGVAAYDDMNWATYSRIEIPRFHYFAHYSHNERLMPRPPRANPRPVPSSCCRSNSGENDRRASCQTWKRSLWL